MHISHNTASDEHILDTAKMWIFVFIQDLNIVKFDVQVLIDGLESSSNRDVVFQLERYLVVDERLEE